jgi:hypothetical protein
MVFLRSRRLPAALLSPTDAEPMLGTLRCLITDYKTYVKIELHGKEFII